MNTQNLFNKIVRTITYPFLAMYYNLFFVLNLPKLTTQTAVDHLSNGYELTANGVLIRIEENS